MEGILAQAREIERSTPTSSLEAYFKIIGLDEMPRSVDELPDEAEIPGKALGDLSQAILASTEGNKERSQDVFVKGGGKFQKSKIYIGTSGAVSILHHLITWVQVKNSNLENIPLLYYHTHPRGLSEFSPADVNAQVVSPDAHFISMAAATDGVNALFVTKRAMRAIPGLRSVVEFGLKRKPSRIIDRADRAEMGELLAELGFGWYIWVPDYQNETKRDYAMKLYSYNTIRDYKDGYWSIEYKGKRYVLPLKSTHGYTKVGFEARMILPADIDNGLKLKKLN